MDQNEKIRERILQKIELIEEKKQLSCRKAHKIAEEFNMPLIEVGRICEEEKVKIYACQLGCF